MNLFDTKILVGASVSALALFILGSGTGYIVGNVKGKAAVTHEWDKSKNEQLERIIALKDELARKGEVHRQENDRISGELRKTEVDYAKTVAALDAERTQRLLNSTQRAASYLERAEAGTAECRSLASHTAKLDRALEEGRSLVKELGSTIERRDSELRLLGAQIQNDRKLLGEK